MADVNTPEERRKKKCRSVINNGLRDGKIKKPEHCARCGKKTSKLTFDHTDYRCPTKGRWLCYSCHRKKTEKNYKRNKKK